MVDHQCAWHRAPSQATDDHSPGFFVGDVWVLADVDNDLPVSLFSLRLADVLADGVLALCRLHVLYLQAGIQVGKLNDLQTPCFLVQDRNLVINEDGAFWSSVDLTGNQTSEEWALSVLAEIQKQYEERYDGRDESTLYRDLVDALGEDDRALWQKEADFDLEHRSEYYEKYGEDEFESRLEADIVRLFESRTQVLA